MEQYQKYGDGRYTVKETIEFALKNKADGKEVTLKEMAMVVGPNHMLGTSYRYLGLLGEELAKEFFIIETACWHLVGKRETVELNNAEFDTYLSLLEKTKPSSTALDTSIKRSWKVEEFAEELSRIHWKLFNMLDFEGDTLAVDSNEYFARKNNLLLAHEMDVLGINSITVVEDGPLTFSPGKHK